MKIAIVGAGLAGLSTAWHACQAGFDVTVFDRKNIPEGSSGVSTGLMHPFVGKTASISWRAFEGMQATKKLLEVAALAAGTDVASFTGIFRPAITDEQKRDFQNNQNEAAVWTSIELPGMPLTPGLWIASGVTIFSRPYLQGLWQACLQKGAVFRLESFDHFDDFDVVVLATGAETVDFPVCKHLQVRSAIGQSLVCRWKDKLPFSLASKGYITVTEDPTICQIGSTYEHTPFPDPKKAQQLLESVSLFYPPAKDFELLEIRNGKRISAKDGHRPIVERVSKNTYVFTGLGSRGMLYHALFGYELVETLKSFSN